MKKRGFLMSILFLLILNLGGHSVLAQSAFKTDINVVIDQFTLVIFPDQKPYIDGNNRTLVPVRFISEELGAGVQWDFDNRQVTILFEGSTIRLSINSNTASLQNGTIERKIDMGTSAVITANNRVMVPLRFVTEALGAQVIWEDSSKTIFIKRIKPDKSFLEHFNSMDAHFLNHISKKDGFKLLKSWESSEGGRTSNGLFTDFLQPISEKQLGDTFYFDFNVQNNSNVSWISIYFSTDKAQKNYFYYNLTPEIILNKNYVSISRKQFQIGAGNPSWADIKYFRIAFQSNTGTSFTMYPKSLATYNSSKAMITLWFDDGWEDNYLNAYRIISNVDPTIRGTIGLVGALIDTDRYLKPKQLLVLKDAGWEFVNHSFTHPLLTGLSDEEIRLEIQRNFSVISKYDPIGAYHFVVPFSAVDDRVLSIIRKNSVSARYIPETMDSIPFDRYRLGFIEVTNTTDFKTIQNAIDEAIEQNKWVGLLFHRIEDPANNRYSFGTQQFKQIIYYLRFRQDDIRVVTPSEAFLEAGMPIK